MKSRIVTFIVPRLFPAVDGLGDYGLSLAKKLRTDFGVDVDFIVADPRWIGATAIEGFKVYKLSACTEEKLLQSLSSNSVTSHTVVLHYVGYGYAKRGCPGWLVSGLEKWRKNSDQHQLITMFHELFAFGPIWTSQFWTSPYQRYLTKELGLISDHSLTSKNQYAEILQKLTNKVSQKIIVLPVFSNIGEPENPPLLKTRMKRMIIFGGKGPRMRLYQDSLSAIERICKILNIAEICDVGPPLDIEMPTILGKKINVLGVKSTEEISELLLNSLMGLVNYPTAYLCKSGIFASYAAHRVLPIVISSQEEEADGVIENVHYINAKLFSDIDDLEKLQVIADNAFQWYQDHQQKIHASTFHSLLPKV